jgi:hypothetical protein
MDYELPIKTSTCTVGTELDNIIFSFKDLFLEDNFTFPILKSSLEFTDKHNLLSIDNILDYHLTTFDFSSLYTNINHKDTNYAIITSCKLLNLPIIIGNRTTCSPIWK